MIKVKIAHNSHNRRSDHHQQNVRLFSKVQLYLSQTAMALLILFALVSCAGQSADTQTVTGHIKINGSTALQPLVTLASQSFQKQHPGAKIDVSGGGSLTGLLSVTAGKVNVGDSDIYADPATFPDPNLTDHIVCVTPFVMIVNPDVKISSLTRQQIIDIYSTNKYQNWSELNGPDVPISPIVRPSTSGTRATFRKYILNGLDEHGKINLQVDDTSKVVSTVASTPGAIGYAALSAVTSKVKYVAIDGEEPTTANIANGKYNFWSYEHMYTLGDNNSLVQAFLTYMTDTSIQATVRKLHYIPINDLNFTSAYQPANNLPAAWMPSTDVVMQESEDKNYE